MDKKAWQEKHVFDDEDMGNICQVKEIFNGTIVSVEELQRDAEGRAVAFAKRYEKNGRNLLQMWSKRT